MTICGSENGTEEMDLDVKETRKKQADLVAKEKARMTH